jgi:hypothetical protein
MAPVVVSSSQQMPVVQLLVPEHSSVSPVQAAAVVQERPVLVAQHTWVFASHAPAAPQAI